MPFNLAMTQAFLEHWQLYNDGDRREELTLFEVAERLKVNVITSAPLGRGLMLQHPLPEEHFPGLSVSAAHLNFVRSVPSTALLSKNLCMRGLFDLL